MLSCSEMSRFPHLTHPRSPYPCNISSDTVLIQIKAKRSTTLHLPSHRLKRLHLTPISTRSAPKLPKPHSPRRNYWLRTHFRLNLRCGISHPVGRDIIQTVLQIPSHTLMNSCYVSTSKQCHHTTTMRSWLAQHPLAHGIAGSLPGCWTPLPSRRSLFHLGRARHHGSW